IYSRVSVIRTLRQFSEPLLLSFVSFRFLLLIVQVFFDKLRVAKFLDDRFLINIIVWTVGLVKTKKHDNRERKTCPTLNLVDSISSPRFLYLCPMAREIFETKRKALIINLNP